MATFRTVSFRVTPGVISDLATRVTAEETASAATVTALATKAASADVAASFLSVDTALATKADQSAVDAGFLGAADAIATKAAASDLTALDSRVGGAENALLGKADSATLASEVAAIHTQFDVKVDALHQAALVLVGADGALEVNQMPGSANVFVYDGSLQTLA